MKYRCFFVVLSLLLAAPLTGQQQVGCQPSIQLVDVTVDRDARYPGMRILARDADCGPMEGLSATDILVHEAIAGGPEQEVKIVRLSRRPVYDDTDLKKEKVEVTFLVDVSELGSPQASREMIEAFLAKGYLNDNTEATYRLRTFDRVLNAAVALDPVAPDPVLAGLQQKAGVAPHLYGALVGTLNEMSLASDKQMLFVFSRGINQAPDYGDAPRLPPRAEDVYAAAEAMGSQLFLFTISTSGNSDQEGADAGAEKGLMSKLPSHTSRTDDGHAIGALPKGVDEIFVNTQRLIATHYASIGTNDPLFKGRLRTYSLTNKANANATPTTFEGRYGGYNDVFELGRKEEAQAWLLSTFLGLVTVGILLTVFGWGIPLLRRARFRKAYVVPFAAQPGRQVLDPMTREPIPVGEPVVNICARVVPLQTWKDCGNKCPHYPGCTNNNLQCDGAGQGDTRKFFSLQGSNRRLNWVWFGALGGFAGWILYALVAGFGETALGEFAKTNFSDLPNGETLVRDALLGACFGTGLTLLLAVMEERTQSRRMSVTRILVRALLGGVVATLAFGLGFLLLEKSVVPVPVLAGAISWLLFGVGLGLVLSLKSSIDVKRGLLGGLLAGLAGFLIYVLIAGLFGTALVAKMASLLVAGATLGLVLDTVVKLAESYEMEYVSPQNYRRNVPLSKWLKSDWDIQIGTQPGSQVYVKWADEAVLPEHAVMKLDGGRVFLFPQGETLINGRIINGQKRTQLESGDTIQLGRRGITQMRFWER